CSSHRGLAESFQHSHGSTVWTVLPQLDSDLLAPAWSHPAGGPRSLPGDGPLRRMGWAPAPGRRAVGGRGRAGLSPPSVAGMIAGTRRGPGTEVGPRD